MNTRQTVKATLAVLVLATVPIAAPDAAAQQPSAESAPVPVQIVTAKRVFISNAPGDFSDLYSGGPGRAYTQFYKAVKEWGRYELVTAPADAELVFEINFTNPISGVSVTDGAFVSGNSYNTPQLRLVILDVKSHVPLWWLSESFETARKQSARDSRFDQAMAILVKKLEVLATTSTAGNAKGADKDQPSVNR
jgi:hypothetical protein